MKSFDPGRMGWIHPFHNSFNILDMLHAVYDRVGVKNIFASEKSNQVSQLIPDAQKYVFILIDGMGYHLLKKTLPDSFLMKNVKLRMNTVFPSSTGTVLTTIATAKWPEKHAINGWFSYNHEHQEPFATLPFKHRFDPDKPLSTPFENVFFSEPIFKHIPIKTNAIVHESIVKSQFSRWSVGNRDAFGYTNFDHAFEILANLLHAPGASFTYVYFGEYDGICHQFGHTSQEAKKMLEDLNQRIERYATLSSNDCTTIIAADHGQLVIQPENFYICLPEDPLCQYFYAPPGCDARSSSFYVKDDCKQAFEEEFKQKFASKSTLLTIEEVNESGLLGPDGITNITKARFGNYIAIWNEGYAFKYALEVTPPDQLHIGNHGGLTKDEMEVPLIIF